MFGSPTKVVENAEIINSGRRRDSKALCLMDVDELRVLLHAAWTNWLRVRKSIYRRMGVNNTEELIRTIVNVEDFTIRTDRLELLYKALKEVVGKDIERARKSVEELYREGVVLTPFFDDHYPRELLRYPASGDYLYPPLLLYWIGLKFNPNEVPIIAVVGTRECSDYGRRLAYEVGRLVADLGAILCTGLAKGIDTAAARGALEHGGKVIGVRPWLKPLSLPSESKSLLKYLGQRLTITSENPWRSVSRKKDINMLYFLRNRIIAGMSKLMIVVEARPKGGSMHQIELALKRGKTVLIFKPKPNVKRYKEYYKAYIEYISKGAKEVRTIEDLREYLVRELNIKVSRT